MQANVTLRRRAQTAFAAAAILTIGIVLLSPWSASAAGGAVPGAVYSGTTSGGGTVTITINADGTRAAFSISFGGTIPAGCDTGLTNAGLPLNTTRTTVASSGGSNAAQVNIALAAFWDQVTGRGVVGTVSTDPAPGRNCPAQRLTWSAVSTSAPASNSRPRAATTASGLVYGAGYFNAGQTPVSLGTAQVTTSADGSAISVGVTYSSSGCTASVTSTGPLPLTDGVLATGPTSGGGNVAVAIGENGFAGAFRIPPGGACPETVATFVMAMPSQATATPAPGATPGPTAGAGAGSGQLMSGSVPASGGFGLIVFSGGTSTQLVTASGCSAASAAFWVTNPDGSFVGYVPGAAVGVVNEAWNARFATGIPAGTALIGKCA